jgi:hypothetical protein
MILRLLTFSLLLGMLSIMIGSSREDAFTYDEPEHITAGYSYLCFQDARLNPEHPPLIKMLAAAPLLMLELQFPLTSPEWLNGQWEVANLFLYEAGNDPHLTLHIMTALALFLAITRVWSTRWNIPSTISWLRSHPAETLMLTWLTLY